MKRLWLLFAQVVTVLLAIWFVVVTLKPEWLQRPVRSAVSLLHSARISTATHPAQNSNRGHATDRSAAGSPQRCSWAAGRPSSARVQAQPTIAVGNVGPFGEGLFDDVIHGWCSFRAQSARSRAIVQRLAAWL